MNTDHLRYFLAIARTGSLVQAAEELFVTSSSLSYAMKALGQELGAPLLATSNKGAQLTEFGRIFLPHAARAMNSIDEGLDGLAEYLQEQRVINVASVVYMSANQVPWFVSSFYSSEAGRASRVNILAAPAQEVLRMAQNGFCDLGFTVLDDDEEYPGLEVYPLAYDRFYLLLPFGHELANKRKVSMQDLLPYDFIGFGRGTAAGRTIARRFERECGQQPRTIFSCNESYQVSGMVAANMGIGIVPDKRFIPQSRVIFKQIDNKPWLRMTGMVYTQKAADRKVVRDFIGLIKQWVPEPIPSDDYPDQHWPGMP